MDHDLPIPSPARAQRRRRRSRGQALTEFAVILPLIVLLTLVAVDFGRLFQVYVGVTNAARQAVVFGAKNPLCVTPTSGLDCTDPNNMTYIARTEMNGDTQVIVSRTCNALCVSGASLVDSRVTVTVTRRFTFMTPLLGSLFPGGGLTIRSQATGVIL